MRIRIAVARLSFASNRFNPVITSAADMDSVATGPCAELDAIDSFREKHPDVDIRIRLSSSARPGGLLADDVWTRSCDELLATLGNADFDAVVLVLDGRTVTVSMDSPELELVRAVRDLIGERPLGLVLGHRANLGSELPPLVDIAIASREASPTRGPGFAMHNVLCELLRRCAGAARLHHALGQTPFTLAAAAVDGAQNTLNEIEAESAPLASVFTGFPYSDVTDACARILAWANTREEALAQVRALGSHFVEKRSAFRLALPGPNLALRKALAQRTMWQQGMVLVTDPADAPEYGGACDSTGLLRALLALQPETPVGFAYLADNVALGSAFLAGVGKAVEISLGARHSRDFGAATEVHALVQHLTPEAGPFGRSALVSVGKVKIAIAERTAIANSPEALALLLPELTRINTLVLKAGMRISPRLAAMARSVIPCDTSGPAALDVASLPLKNLRAR